jgi:hypothetical protein
MRYDVGNVRCMDGGAGPVGDAGEALVRLG